MRLTRAELRRIAYPDSGQVLLWDDTIKGFGIRVTPGSIAFVLQYAPGGGRQKKRITLGRYGVLDIDEARALARKALLRAATGEEQETSRLTMADVWSAYEADDFPKASGRGFKAPLTIAKDAGRWQRYLAPHLGDTRLDRIEDHHIETMRTRVAQGGAPGTADQCAALAKALLSYARRAGLTRRTAGMTVRLRGSRRVSNPLDLGAVARLREVLRGQRDGPHMFSAMAVELALLTGMRIGEVLHLRWDWVDPAAGVIRLPSDKADQRHGRTVHVSCAAAALLQEVPRIARNPHVFPGRRTGCHLVNIAKPWARFRAMADLPTRTRIHDLRHTFGTQAAMQGVSMPALKELMGHRNPATTQRYISLASDHIRTELAKVRL